MIQFFFPLSASLCLSILTGERPREGRGQGKEKGAEKPGVGRDRGEEVDPSSLPKSSPESSPGRPKVPAMIAAALPSADWQTRSCIFARPHLESRGGTGCLSQRAGSVRMLGGEGKLLLLGPH